MHLSRSRDVIVAVVAVFGVGCGGLPWAADDGAVRLTTPPCDDNAACAEAYEFDGRLYAVSDTDLTDDEVAELEVERFDVANPGFDELVTTDDPSRIYLSTDDGWLEARSDD